MDSNKKNYKFEKNKIKKVIPSPKKKNEKKKTNQNNTTIHDYFEHEEKNLCLECGIDMGPENPRQLCGKTRCYQQ